MRNRLLALCVYTCRYYTINVGGCVLLTDVGGLDGHRLTASLCFRRWPVEHRFLQLTIQDLDEAVGAAVVVDAAAMTFTPTERHQIELSISTVHQIPCVSIHAY